MAAKHPIELSASERNHLVNRLDDFIKKIQQIVDKKNATVIKHFWRDHVEEMRDLLAALKKAGMRKEYATFDRIMNQVLYKAVLINKSIRLAKDMSKAFTNKSITTEQIRKFKKRSKKIDVEMKRMGFLREAKMHECLFRLHLKEEKHEIENRVTLPSSSLFKSQAEEGSPGQPDPSSNNNLISKP